MQHDDPKELDYSTLAHPVSDTLVMIRDGTYDVDAWTPDDVPPELINLYEDDERGWPAIRDEIHQASRRARRSSVSTFVVFASEAERVKHHNTRDRSPTGGTLTEEQWFELRRGFGGCCAYCGCGAPRPVLEHVRPVALGGRTNIENVVPSCVDCNRRKGLNSVAEWQGEGWAALFAKKHAGGLAAARRAIRKRKERKEAKSPTV